MPGATALEMLCLVKRLVREQQRCPDCDGRADDQATVAQPMGRLPSLSPPELASRCACCWHVDFVGGARRRGRAGHDADLLVWHKQKAASWDSGRRHCVLGLLLDELERSGRLLPQQGGWQMARTSHDQRRESLPGVRSHRRNVQQLSTSTRGFENLSTDYHDKVFGVWRSTSGRHHRIDIIVNSFPEARPSAATPLLEAATPRTRGCSPVYGYSRLQPYAPRSCPSRSLAGRARACSTG